jgi:hypothetical protein
MSIVKEFRLYTLFFGFLFAATGKPKLRAWRALRRACLQKVKAVKP